jgi:hypothetical protein
MRMPYPRERRSGGLARRALTQVNDARGHSPMKFSRRG